MTTLEQETTETTLDPRRALTGLDRCDSCNAQAYVRAVLGDSELLFCAHHGTKHEEKLKPLASVWHDERDRLTA